MIPKYLKIKGLYSYQTEQEIHFDALTDASLFGIFGAVGSGKSSILEAITFALYGDTERLNKSGDDRTYNMMNLRSDELLIDFECIAGKDAGRYRFTVRGRRNSKNFKDVKTFERKGYVWENENWVPLPEDVNAESIIGLSYDNFRRTIIIPQGRFQEFIELRDSDRTRMMKELFQLEKYDLTRKVGGLSKKNDLAISHVDGQLLGLHDVSPEIAQAEETRRNEIRTNIEKSAAELLVLIEQENVFIKQKTTAEKAASLQSQLETLHAQRPAMQAKEEALRLFEICSLHFRSLLDQQKTLQVSIERDEKTFLQQQIRIRELSETAEAQKQILAELKPRYDNKQELLETAAELEKVIRILSNQQAVQQRSVRLRNGEEMLLEKEKSMEALKLQKQERETENEVRKAALTDLQEIAAVQAWFVQAANLTDIRTAVKKEADALQTDLQSQQELLEINLEKVRRELTNALPQGAGIGDFRETAQHFFTQNENKRRELRTKMLHAGTRLALQQYAVGLTDGDACPLCGSAHHPAVLHADGSIENELAIIEKNVAELDAKDDLMRKTQLPVERTFSQIENLEKQKASIRERWTEAKWKLDAHDAEFAWPKFDKNDRAGFDMHFQEVMRTQALIRETELTIRQMATQLDAAQAEKVEKYEKPIRAMREEILQLENTTSILSTQLERVNLAELSHANESSIREKMQALRSSFQEVTQLFEQTEKQLEGIEKERNVLSGSQATLETALNADRKTLLELQQLLTEKRLAFAFENEAEIEAILQQNLRIDAERKVLETFRLTLETTGRELENLLRDHTGSVYDAESHAAVTAAREALQETLNALRKDEGGLDRLLKKLAEDLARKATLIDEQNKLLLRKSHLDDLTKLFRSSGFVDYASSIYLKNLIQAANHRFHQMTHQRLHLELGEGNSFWVRDLLNGGHMRLLKTLSGGQKFQAALSLALALADHIHVRNGSQHNFFFLDEGFGSLDKNALQTVFDTLKSLRKENRIVGIISHVEDLQQEIQAYLRVTDTEEGSRIEESWKS